VGPGAVVHRGEEIATNTSPFGRERSVLKAPFSGLVIGATTLPSVSPGDAVVHVVKLGRGLARVERALAST